MNLRTVQALYTERIAQYHAFTAFFQSRRGLRKLLQARVGLEPGLSVLDAGCGSGMASFALIDALRSEKLDYERIDAFDVTPAMLSRFHKRDLPRALAALRARLAPGAKPRTSSARLARRRVAATFGSSAFPCHSSG